MTRSRQTIVVAFVAALVAASVASAQTQAPRITSGPEGSTVTSRQQDGREELVITMPASPEPQQVVVALGGAKPAGTAAGKDTVVSHTRPSWWWLVVGVLLCVAYLYTFRDLVRPEDR